MVSYEATTDVEEHRWGNAIQEIGSEDIQVKTNNRSWVDRIKAC